MLAFMQAVNSVRLVLGTMLDVGEDDDIDEVGRRRRGLARVPPVRLPVSWLLEASVRTMSAT